MSDWKKRGDFLSSSWTISSALRKRAQAKANSTGRPVQIDVMRHDGGSRGSRAPLDIILPQKQAKNPAKAVRLKNFTGTIRVNPNKTVSVVGRKKGTKRK